MAKIFYLLKQNKAQGSKIYGKWFAHGKTIETLNTRRMANHIAEHGSIYTPDVVFGVLEKFRSCLLEMLLNSKRVKIDGLGIFYTTLENEKGGAAKKEDFSPTKNLKALHIRFLPDQEAETNISSREFIKKAEFVNAEALAGQLLESESGGEIEDPDNTDNGQTGGSQNQTGSGNTSGGNSGSNTGSNTGGDNTGHGSGDMN